MHISRLAIYPEFDFTKLDNLYHEAMKNFKHKIIVLDDDPTGIQKVHGVHVYTNWEEGSIRDGLDSEEQMFFILTNSRAFSEDKTQQVHETITKRIDKIASELGVAFLIISRGDSTLRGHYPLETEIIKESLLGEIDGELMIPFFKEGGRYTVDNIHYVEIDEKLIPAAETEFAKDRTFPFDSSDLREYIEEKTVGSYRKDSIVTIDLMDLRELHIDKITEQLMSVTNFNKVVVNAISDDDLKVLSVALITAMNRGKNFLFRTAASFTKVIGDVADKELLTKEEMIQTDSEHGGLIIVGSHVTKTTEQLKQLLTIDGIHEIPFQSNLVLDEDKFADEISKRTLEIDEYISKGKTVVIYTDRKRLDLGEGMAEKELELAVKISDGLTNVIQSTTKKPKYIIAKGGITSSEIGTTALGVTKAFVLGQALPGVPVWKTDDSSKYPNMPYIIFPGNVGYVEDLYKIVKKLD